MGTRTTTMRRALVGALAVTMVCAAVIEVDPVPRADAAPSASLRRYPYLTDLVGGNVTVNWSTDRSATTGKVVYGLAPTCTGFTQSATKTSITVGSGTAATSQYQWKANISGLSPDTAYCYRPYLGSANVDLLGTDPSPIFTSQVAPGSQNPFSFAVFGDWGQVDANGNNVDQANLMSRIASSGVRFAVTTGDTGYPGGTQTTYGDLYLKGPDTSAIFGPSYWAAAGDNIPLFNTSGNHGFNSVGLLNFPQDRAVTSSAGKYAMQTFCCANGTLSASYPSSWYAFDAGPARFYVLTAAWSESNVGSSTAYQNDYDNHWTPTSEEYLWLQNDLATHPGGLKFAFFHYPLYSDNSTETSSTPLRGPASLEGLLASNGVDIGFNGHAHMYQRNTATSDGLITYLTGGGGAKLQPIGAKGCTPIDAYGIGWSNTSAKGSRCGGAVAPTAKSQVFHFLKVTVAGSTVTVTPTDSLGNTFDVQTYDFGGVTPPADTTPPTAATLTAAATSPTNVDLAWSGSTDNVGVTGYEIRRNNAVLATVGNQSAYSDTSAQPGQTYQYTVVTKDAAGNRSADSNVASVTTPQVTPNPPAAPANVGASPGDTVVDVTWSSSANATSYTVRRSTTSGGPYSAVATGITTTSFHDTGLTNGTRYFYVVSAVGAGGESAVSAEAGATPAGTVVTPPNVVFADDFETGDLSKWTSKGGLVVQSAIVHGGSFAAQGNTTVGNTYAKKTLTATTASASFTTSFNLAAGFTSQVNLLRYRLASDTSLGYLYVTTAGKLALRNDAGVTTVTSTVSVTTGVWHELEFRLTVNGTSSSVEIVLDGVRVDSLSGAGQNWGSGPIGKIQIGEVQSGRAYNVTFDDVTVATP